MPRRLNRPRRRPLAGGEILEGRRLLAFDPSPFEQAMFEHVNRMRIDPQEELNVFFSSLDPLVATDQDVQFAVDFFEVDAGVLASQWAQLTPVAPLAWSEELIAAAEFHNDYIVQFDQQSHQLPGEPDLAQRLRDAGYSFTAAGENVYAFSESAFYGHAGFAIDWGNSPTGIQEPPGHRNNIMSSSFREVGIAATEDTDDGTDVGPWIITQDFGSRSGFQPKLLGVVWEDGFTNGVYDPGEGYGGVTVEIEATDGTTYALETMSAGGYQIEIPPGTYQVTARGLPLPGTLVVSEVVFGNANVKVDFQIGTTNRLPNANNDSLTVDERGWATYDILANDTDANGSIDPTTVQIVDAPAYGTIQVDPDTGTLTYRPHSDHVGTDLVTYRVRDDEGALSRLARVEIETLYRTGDFDHDGQVSGRDIDLLFAQVASAENGSRFDLNADEVVNAEDVAYLVETVLGTQFGDANLDGSVDGTDLSVWSDYRFTSRDTSWSRGDFNGDLSVDGRDFHIWLTNRFTTVSAAERAGPSQRLPRAPLGESAAPLAVRPAWDAETAGKFAADSRGDTRPLPGIPRARALDVANIDRALQSRASWQHMTAFWLPSGTTTTARPVANEHPTATEPSHTTARPEVLEQTLVPLPIEICGHSISQSPLRPRGHRR